MQNLRWIKLSCELFLNRKIYLLRTLDKGDEYCLIWIYLLTLAGRLNTRGRLVFSDGIPYTEELIAKEGGFKKSTVEEAFGVFLEYRMIVKTKTCYKIKNWLKYQSTEEYEKKKLQGRERVKKWRERAKSEKETQAPAGIGKEELKKLKLQISQENLNHYFEVANSCISKGKQPKNMYEFIVNMASHDKKLKVMEKRGINQGLCDEQERLKLPDDELSPSEIAFKRALQRSYGET
jgi:predicted phage replisome organizer